MNREEDWLREARAEIAAASGLVQGGHWSWCCFTAQQAAEKALKAVCHHFRDPQPGHNLNVLLQSVERHTSVPQPVRDACANLNRYYIGTRYPDAFSQGAPAEQFFERDARTALSEAGEVMGFADGIVGNP